MKRLLAKIAAGFALLCGVVLLALLPISYPSGGIAFAQVNNPVIIIVGSTPSACNTLPLQIVAGTANLYGTNGSGGCTQISGPGSGAVTSVFGRTGAVTANTGDYTAAQVTHALDLSQTAMQTMSGNLAIPVGSSLTTPIFRSTDGSATATTLAGRWTYGASSALSTPTSIWTGSPITGGSGSTTLPMILIQPTGTTSSTWSTAGTFFGINAPSGFSGNILDFQSNGTSRLSLSAGGTLNMATANAVAYHTFTNCSSAASPAVCGAAASGSVAIPTGASQSLQVNTTALTTNSQVLITVDASLSTKLGITCDSTLADLVGGVAVTARTGGSNFTITHSGTTASQLCITYSIIN